ncbi:nuclear envelope integral membrane protein 1-like [Pocillopora verrucosa]|uniref:nuclear envelope integral membrane protein 1-like n=1 Tax=Pocillopora verrucosa TaxID=203993 RepID=UPI00333F1C2D
MAAGSESNCFFFYLFFFSVLRITSALRCEDISVQNLSRDWHFLLGPKDSIIAVCVHGGELRLSRLWASVKVMLKFEKTEVQFYEAESCSALNPANKSWASVFQSFVTSRNVLDQIMFSYSPFKTSCFAVDLIKERQTVRVEASLRAIDWYFPVTFLAGLVIFYNAERLSRNALFFYSSGVSLGVIASLLILVYILHRLVPGRGSAYAILLGGWSFAAYLIQFTCGHLKELMVNQYQWVIGYLVIVGTISFCVCYYRGPVTSDRGLDLIRWMLQFIGLTLLYMGTRSDVVSFGLITVVLFSHVIRSSGILMKIFPKTWISYGVYYFFFPPKHKFLSLEEYALEGAEETSRALEDLREYCKSPECDTWRVVSRLKHPARFASFVASGQHFLEEEVKKYEDDPSAWMTSDSDGSDGEPDDRIDLHS